MFITKPVHVAHENPSCTALDNYDDKPEKVFPHTVDNDLIIRKQLQRLLIAIKYILDTTEGIQLFCPFEKSKSE